jgi:hypothetical protein
MCLGKQIHLAPLLAKGGFTLIALRSARLSAMISESPKKKGKSDEGFNLNRSKQAGERLGQGAKR